jgi:hypothetical protein
VAPIRQAALGTDMRRRAIEFARSRIENGGSRIAPSSILHLRSSNNAMSLFISSRLVGAADHIEYRLPFFLADGFEGAFECRQ